jgi:hypothetical protein
VTDDELKGLFDSMHVENAAMREENAVMREENAVAHAGSAGMTK